MIWLFLIICLILLCIKLYRVNQYWKEKGVPHLKPLPFVGSFGKFVLYQKSFAEITQDVYNKIDARYAGCYQFILPALLIRDLDLIKQINIKDFDHFTDHKSFFSASDEIIVARHLFSLKGREWRNMRTILSPMFTSSKMRTMFAMMMECGEQFTKYCLRISHPDKPVTVEIKNLYTKYTNDVIASCAFGIKCDSLEDERNEFYLNGKDVSTLDGAKCLRFAGYIISARLMKLLNIKVYGDKLYHYFKNIVKIAINTRQKEGIIRLDMLHLLIEARRKYEESQKINPDPEKFEVNDDDITAQVVLFFIAGIDTTSTLLSFMSFELAMNQDIQRKLQEEIDTTLEECDGKLTYEILLNMKYLNMVIQESLRKWPPVGTIDRECVKPYTIEPQTPDEKPVQLNKGDVVWFPVMGIQRDPKYFPNPNRFDPERFSDENKSKIHDFSFMPFGSGPRNCIGYRFALLESKAIFVHLLSKFDIVVVDKTDTTGTLNPLNLLVDAKYGHWLGLKLRK